MIQAASASGKVQWIHWQDLWNARDISVDVVRRREFRRMNFSSSTARGWLDNVDNMDIMSSTTRRRLTHLNVELNVDVNAKKGSECRGFANGFKLRLSRE